jgi:hypothetical protein
MNDLSADVGIDRAIDAKYDVEFGNCIYPWRRPLGTLTLGLGMCEGFADWQISHAKAQSRKGRKETKGLLPGGSLRLGAFARGAVDFFTAAGPLG